MSDLSSASRSQNPLVFFGFPVRRSTVVLVSLLVFAFGLYLFKNTEPGLWQDEGYSYRDGLHPSSFILDAPFYFVVFHFWMLISDNLVWLRGFSAYFTLLSIIAVYVLGRRWVDETTGLVAAIIFALSPMTIHWARQVRFYSLGTFIVIMGTLALLEALDKPGKGRIAAWASLRLVAWLTIPFSAFLLLPDALIVMERRGPSLKRCQPFASWLVLVLCLWLPALYRLLRETPEFMNDWVKSLPQPTFARWLGVSLLAPFDLDFHVPGNAFELVHAAYVLAGPRFLVTLLLFAMAAIACLIPPKRREARQILCFGLLPATTLLFCSLFGSSLLVPRYFLFVFPFTALWLSAGILKIYRRWPKLVAVCSIAWLFHWGYYIHQNYFYPGPDGWREAAETVLKEFRPGDVVLADGSASAFRYYLRHSAVPISFYNPTLLPPADAKRTWVIFLQAGHDIRERAELLSRLRARYSQIVTLKFRRVDELLAFDHEPSSQLPAGAPYLTGRGQ